jgi:hypothetical protein
MLRYHNVNEPDSEPGFFDEHRDPITCVATTVSNLALVRNHHCFLLSTHPSCATIVYQPDYKLRRRDYEIVRISGQRI